MDNEVYRDGILRDVYPMNFLTAPQLNKRIGRSTLRRWIGQTADRGELSHFMDDVWLWRVPEKLIPRIRSELDEVGLIFDFRRYLTQ